MKICGSCHIEKEDLCFKIRTDKRRNPALIYLNNLCNDCEAKRQRERVKRQRSSTEGKARHNKWALDFHKRHRAALLEIMKQRNATAEYKEYMREYRRKNKDRINETGRKRNKKYIQKCINERPDFYAARKLSEQLGMPREQLTPELIEAKKLVLAIKRKIKNNE